MMVVIVVSSSTEIPDESIQGRSAGSQTTFGKSPQHQIRLRFDY